MLLRFALLAATTTLAPATPANQTPPEANRASEREAATVVVTATRLADSERALKACIARKCPPDQDIQATLVHAENLFVAGQYKAARSVLLKSRARNLRFGADYPEPVAGLLRANARIGAHLGESDTDRFDTIVAVDVLKRAFPADDPRVLQGRLDLADYWVRHGDVDTALGIYRQIERLAGDRPVIRGTALLRQLIVFDRVGDIVARVDGRDLKRVETALLEDRDPALAPFQFAARLIAARRATKAGDSKALDQVLADYRRNPLAGERPVLISAPTIDLGTVLPSFANLGGYTSSSGIGRVDATGVDVRLLRTPPSSLYEDQWIDVSFWINPDGTVSDAGVLREGPQTDSYWQKPVLQAIAGRRYAPFDPATRQFAQLRVERITFTSVWTDVTGTRQRVRSINPRIESLDLTVEPPRTARTQG